MLRDEEISIAPWKEEPSARPNGSRVMSPFALPLEWKREVDVDPPIDPRRERAVIPSLIIIITVGPLPDRHPGLRGNGYFVRAPPYRVDSRPRWKVLALQLFDDALMPLLGGCLLFARLKVVNTVHDDDENHEGDAEDYQATTTSRGDPEDGSR